MTKDDIIRMAQEAGLHLATDVNWMPIIGLEYAEKFAALVAAAVEERLKWDGIHSCHPDCQRPACVHTRKTYQEGYEAGRKDENEACAKVCEEYQDAVDRHRWPNGYECAAAIRARREQ